MSTSLSKPFAGMHAHARPERAPSQAAKKLAHRRACPPGVLRQLKTIGLLGSIHQRHDDATIVIRTIEGMVRNPKRYHLQRARAHAMRGDTSVATEMLNEHYAADVDDDRALVTLGAALRIGGDPQWRDVLERVLALSTNIAARTVALQLVEFFDSLPSRDRERRSQAT